MNSILLMIFPVLLFSSCNKEENNFEEKPPINTGVSVRMVVGNRHFIVSLYDNPTADAFLAMLPLTLNMSDFNRNEKVGSLPSRLITAASNPGTIHTGDIMLYGSSSLVLFYEKFSTSYSYTRIGQITHVEGLKTTLGSGDVTLKFELE